MTGAEHVLEPMRPGRPGWSITPSANPLQRETKCSPPPFSSRSASPHSPLSPATGPAGTRPEARQPAQPGKRHRHACHHRPGRRARRRPRPRRHPRHPLRNRNRPATRRRTREPQVGTRPHHHRLTAAPTGVSAKEDPRPRVWIAPSAEDYSAVPRSARNAARPRARDPSCQAARTWPASVASLLRAAGRTLAILGGSHGLAGRTGRAGGEQQVLGRGPRRRTRSAPRPRPPQCPRAAPQSRASAVSVLTFESSLAPNLD